MSSLLKTLLSLSFSGTLLILLFFLAKPLWKDKLSKQWQYYIWLIVIARLLFPFAPEINLVGMIFQQFEQTKLQTEQIMPNSPKILSEIEQQEPIITDNESKADIEEPLETQAPVLPQNMLSLSRCIFLVWLIIALILFVRKITIYQSFVRYIKAGQKPVEEIELLNHFGILLSDAKIKRTIELSTNPLISSPLFMGLFRPCIVLPDTRLTDTDFCYTIQHELIHYKRHDMFYKWLIQLVTCIHWFNPFVYLMGREINRNCELSCDETLICNMTTEEKAAYGDTLLNAMKSEGNYKDSLASVTLNESKELLKERLDSIMKYKKKSKFCIVISVILTITLCFGAATTGAYTKTQLLQPITSLNKNSVNMENNAITDFPAFVYTGGIAANNSQYGASVILHKGDRITISLLEDLEAWKIKKDKLKLEISIGGNSGITQDFVLSNNNRSITFQAKETATHFVQVNNPNQQLLNYAFSLSGFSQPPKIELTSLNEKRRFGQFLLKANTSYVINASWKETNVDSVTAILQQGEQIENYQIKNGIPFFITVPQDGVYIIDCINKNPIDIRNFSCTLSKFQDSEISDITIEQVKPTINKNNKSGIKVSFANWSAKTIQEIYVRLNFPNNKNSTGIHADLNTKNKPAWKLNANKKASYFWSFSHDNAGSFNIAITAYKTADGKLHTISEDNWKWTEFYYPGKDTVTKNNNSKELFTSYLSQPPIT